MFTCYKNTCSISWTVKTPICFHIQIMFHINFSLFPSNYGMGGVSGVSNQPGGINDGVLPKIQHMEQREWLPNAAHHPSLANLSCCYWLRCLMMPEALHQLQQQGDCCRGLDGSAEYRAHLAGALDGNKHRVEFSKFQSGCSQKRWKHPRAADCQRRVLQSYMSFSSPLITISCWISGFWTVSL